MKNESLQKLYLIQPINPQYRVFISPMLQLMSHLQEYISSRLV